MSEDGTQQCDSDTPSPFAEKIHTLVKKPDFIINVWYLDDGNLPTTTK